MVCCGWFRREKRTGHANGSFCSAISSITSRQAAVISIILTYQSKFNTYVPPLHIAEYYGILFLIVLGGVVMLFFILIPILLIIGITLTFLFMRNRVKTLPKLGGKLSPQTVHSSISQRAGDSLSLLIRCPTVSISEPDGDYIAFTALHRVLPYRYPHIFNTMTIETVNTHSLVLRWRGSIPNADPLLFCAHLDVVPAGEDWQEDPFGGNRSGGNIYGRGALDVKNILVCLLEAAESLIAEGFVPESDIYFAFGHDEEIGGQHGAGEIIKYFTQKNLRFAMVLDEGGFISAHRGQHIAEIGVAEKGIMNLNLRCRDKGGHASMPPQQSALGRLSEALSRLESCQPTPHLTPLTEDYFLTIAGMLTKRQRFALANRAVMSRQLRKALTVHPQYNALLRTTAVATMASSGQAHNVLPKVAEATVNVRLLTGMSSHEYLAFAQRLTADLDVEMTMDKMKEPGIVSEYHDTTFDKLANAVRDTFGPITVAPYLMVGSTDANYYEPLSNHVYRFGPFAVTAAQRATIHAADEYISEQSLGTAVLFYRTLMAQGW